MGRESEQRNKEVWRERKGGAVLMKGKLEVQTECVQGKSGVRVLKWGGVKKR